MNRNAHSPSSDCYHLKFSNSLRSKQKLASIKCSRIDGIFYVKKHQVLVVTLSCLEQASMVIQRVIQSGGRVAGVLSQAWAAVREPLQRPTRLGFRSQFISNSCSLHLCFSQGGSECVWSSLTIMRRKQVKPISLAGTPCQEMQRHKVSTIYLAEELHNLFNLQDSCFYKASLCLGACCSHRNK